MIELIFDGDYDQGRSHDQGRDLDSDHDQRRHIDQVFTNRTKQFATRE